MCCLRDDCPPADGQWKRSSRGRRFGGWVPGREGCGGGGSLAWSGRRRREVGWFRGTRRVGEQKAGVGGGFANARGGGPCDKGRVATVRALQLWKNNRWPSARRADVACRDEDRSLVVSAESHFSGAIVERGVVCGRRSCRVAEWKNAWRGYCRAGGPVLPDPASFSCLQSRNLLGCLGRF